MRGRWRERGRERDVVRGRGREKVVMRGKEREREM